MAFSSRTTNINYSPDRQPQNPAPIVREPSVLTLIRSNKKYFPEFDSLEEDGFKSKRFSIAVNYFGKKNLLAVCQLTIEFLEINRTLLLPTNDAFKRKAAAFGYTLPELLEAMDDPAMELRAHTFLNFKEDRPGSIDFDVPHQKRLRREDGKFIVPGYSNVPDRELSVLGRVSDDPTKITSKIYVIDELMLHKPGFYYGGLFFVEKESYYRGSLVRKNVVIPPPTTLQGQAALKVLEKAETLEEAQALCFSDPTIQSACDKALEDPNFCVALLTKLEVQTVPGLICSDVKPELISVRLVPNVQRLFNKRFQNSLYIAVYTDGGHSEAFLTHKDAQETIRIDQYGSLHGNVIEVRYS